MAKVILEFNLNEEHQEFEQAHNGWRYLATLQEIDNALRRRYKHTSPPNEEAREEYEAICKLFYEIVNDREIKL